MSNIINNIYFISLLCLKTLHNSLLFFISESILLLKQINLQKAHFTIHCFVVIYTSSWKLIKWRKLIFSFSGDFYEFVWQYLHYLCPIWWSISINLPLKEIFLWMELYSIKRIRLSFKNRKKFFTIWCCCKGLNVPIRLQLCSAIIVTFCYCIMMIKVKNSFSKF